MNTHTPASLNEAFPPAEAKRLADRLEIHYTPKHGSGLNMAEIEQGVLAGAPPAALAWQAGVPLTTVYRWARRFATTGVAGLCPCSPQGCSVGPSRACTVAEVVSPKASPPSARVGDMEEVRGRAAGRAPAPVVAGDGADVGAAGMRGHVPA